jgi:hypothetical protein
VQNREGISSGDKASESLGSDNLLTSQNNQITAPRQHDNLSSISRDIYSVFPFNGVLRSPHRANLWGQIHISAPSNIWPEIELILQEYGVGGDNTGFPQEWE